MTRALLPLLCLFATAAQANVDFCIKDAHNGPLRALRVTSPSGPFTNYELETDNNGCVSVPASFGTWVVPVDVHATNRVVQVQNLGFPIVDSFLAYNDETYEFGEEFRWAEKLRVAYERSLYGFGPFQSLSPLDGSLAGGPYVTVDIDSPIIVDEIYVEPLPVGINEPARMHLTSGDPVGWNETHEFAHAAMFSRWSFATRNAIQFQYAQYVAGPTPYHNWDEPSSPMVAFIEAFGGVGSAFHYASAHTEDAYFDSAANEVAALGANPAADDTIEGVVFGIVYYEFALRTSLDFAIQSVMDCEQITLRDYAQCMADTYGRSSETYQSLRDAADAFGVHFAGDPVPGDWTYCNDIFRCGIHEGDCNNDGHCEEGLECRHDVGSYLGGSSRLDVCDVPPNHQDYCSEELPCAQGEGDCDNDAECRGNMVCVPISNEPNRRAFDICTLPVRP